MRSGRERPRHDQHGTSAVGTSHDPQPPRAAGPARHSPPRPAHGHPGPPGSRSSPPSAAAAPRPPSRHPGASLARPHRRACADLDARGTASATAAQRSALRRPRRRRRPVQPLRHAGLDPAGRRLPRAAPGSPATAARSWLEAHAAVVRHDAAGDGRPRGWSTCQRLADSSARAVLLRQQFGGLAPALDGMVTVGVANGAGRLRLLLARRALRAVPPAATLSPPQAWPGPPPTSAATVDAGAITTAAGSAAGGWTRLGVSRASPRSSRPACGRWPSPTARVRPVFEANVVDVAGRHRLGVHR